MRIKPFPFYEIISWVIIGLAFSYSVLRAYYLPVTHDEAVTVNYWASSAFGNIFLYKGFAAPNNHLLNTFFIKIVLHFFALSEFVIRIPALIGHALYLAGIYKILKLFLKTNLLLCGLIVLVFNPFMLQIFAIARGYALGLGFSIIGIYFLLQCVLDQQPASKPENSLNDKNSYIDWGFLMLAFGTMSCFTFFHLYLSFFLWFMAYKIRMKASLGKLYASAAPSFLLLISTCLLPVIQIVLSHKYIAEVGTKGIWLSTVLSLINVTLYNQPSSHWLVQFFQVFIIGVMATGVFLMLTRKGEILQQPTFALFNAVFSWLVICCVLIIMEGRIVRFGYSSGRTALYFIPLFFLSFLLVTQCLLFLGEGLRHFRTAVYSFVFLLTFGLFINFMYCVNFRGFYRIGAYCESARDAVNYLNRLHKKEHLKEQPFSVGANRNSRPILDFYIRMYNIQCINELPYNQDLRSNFNYYFLTTNLDDVDEKTEIIKEFKSANLGRHLRIIKTFQDGAFLALP